MDFKEFLQKTGKIVKEKNPWLAESYFNPETHKLKKHETWGRYSNDCTFSETWSMGGTYGTCYSDEKIQISSELEPEIPVEFDLILEQLCPTCTFIQYNGIKREVIERGEIENSDYYGGGTTEGYKGFKIKTLFEALTKRGLLD